MKTYLYILLFSVLSFSCTDDFLKELDKDKIIPKTLSDYSELLYGEAYINDGETPLLLRYMTDDVTTKTGSKGWFGVTDMRNIHGSYYNWSAQPEYTIKSTINNDKNWDVFYHSILICNIVLNDIKEIDGDISFKKQLKAEAYFVRAFNYFMLVNMYGEPYKNGSEMGVPINDLIGTKDVKFKRSTTGEIYNLIKADLDNSIKLFKEANYKESIFRGNLKASLLLRSRVALYTQDWQTTIDMASELINISPNLYNLNRDYNKGEAFLNINNPEILYTYGSYKDNSTIMSGTYYFSYSDDLETLLNKEGDLRGQIFFKGNSSSPEYNKNAKEDESGVYGFALRTAEAYLNRAEAYAQLGNSGKCLEDLNTLRSNRFSKNVTLPSDIDALTLAREERRIELCFEEHRWFDLRRQGCPRLEHKYMTNYKNASEYDIYVLNENDISYTLPLPLEVAKVETMMRNIKRLERQPIKK